LFVASRSLKGVSPEDQLRLFYTGRHPELERFRKRFRFVPASPRCRVCYAPFGGVGGAFLRRRGYVRWPKNPNICQRCIVEFDHVGCRGAEVEMSMLFADVRGATELAGGMSASDFSNLMSRFFRVATTALLDAGALVDKFVGDEVVGLFVPGVAGDDHAGRAIEAAEALLRGVGFDDDPWVAVGVGVHTGIVYLGLVGDSSDGFPGLSGWGAKSASAVLARYGHLEDIPNTVEDWDVPGLRSAAKLAETLQTQREAAELFRLIATVVRTVDVGKVSDWKWQGPTADLREIMTDLGAPELADRAERLAAD
jgi:hypothetical protein